MKRVHALLLTALFGCDSIDVGRPDAPEGPPKVVRVLVQDETTDAPRFVVTDVLLGDQPLVACALTNPCPAELDAASPGHPVLCAYPESELAKPEAERVGACPDPLHPSITPPIVGEPLGYDESYEGPDSGVQIRVIVDRILDPALDAALAADGQTVVKLSDASGDLEVFAFYDPTGFPGRVAYPSLQPSGPAIVIKPINSLLASTRYSITIDAAQVKAKDGAALEAAGPFSFTTEAAHPVHGVAPSEDGYTLAEIRSTDAISFFLNAPVATATSVVIVADAVKLVEGDTMTDVPVLVFTDGACAHNDLQLNIVATSTLGVPIPWPEGELSYDFSKVARSAGPDGGDLASSALGDPLAGSFTVTATDALGLNPAENLTLPTDCE